MAIPSTRRRGLRDIRTHTALAHHASKPYLTFLRIGALEMERVRREAERDNAIARVRDLDARCREIDAEKDGLLRAIGERRGSPAQRGARRGASTTAGRVRIRY